MTVSFAQSQKLLSFWVSPEHSHTSLLQGKNSGHSLWPENRGSEGAIAGLTQPSDDGGRSLTKAPGLIRWFSLVGRYYDPNTDQFLSIDPEVAETGQPYAFTGDDPLNVTDPLGLSGSSGIAAAVAYAQAVKKKCGGHPNRNGCRGINVGHDLVSGLDKARHLGHQAAHSVDVGASKVQAFGEGHLSLSAEVCFQSCVGIAVQQGHFQTIQGSGGDLFGAGASLGPTARPPDPNGASDTQIGLGPADVSSGPGGADSIGIGPGYIFGFGGQSTSSEFG